MLGGDRVCLKGLVCQAFIGVLPAEKKQRQELYLDLELEQGFFVAARTDELSQATDYSAVALAAIALVENSCYDLVESLSSALADFLLLEFANLVAVKVTVHKPSAPLSCSFADVICECSRFRRYEVVLSLGSNMGDRAAQLNFALHALRSRPELEKLRCSSFYESKAWGNTEQADYLNAVVILYTDLDPFSLLYLCQDIESEAGRLREERWGPRTLDIDIISYGSLQLNTAQLQIPHPYAQVRNFVYLPLRELRGQNVALEPNIRLYSSPEVVTTVSYPADLVVVDMQHDFIAGSLACEGAEAAVTAVTAYINSHPDIRVYYSADQHSAQNKSFICNGGTWPVHCQAGTAGARIATAFYLELSSERQRPGSGTIFYKGVDDEKEEYSAASALNRAGVSLAQVLAPRVLLTGIASEFCVRETALALKARGHEVTIWQPGLAYVSLEGHQANLADLAARGFTILDS